MKTRLIQQALTLVLLIAGASILLSTAQAEGGKRVIFFGDSLTAGLGLAVKESYPALMTAIAESDGVPIVSINAGVSGDTTAGGLRRVDWTLKSGCDAFVLALGANDGLRGLSPAEMQKNLTAIIERVRSSAPTCKVVLAGMYALPNLGAEYGEAFKAAFIAVAKNENVPFIPFLLEGVARIPELNQADRLHPTAEGQKIIAKTVWTYLKPALNNRDGYN